MRKFVSLLLVLASVSADAFGGEVRAYYERDGIFSRQEVDVDGASHPFYFFVGFSGLREAMKSNPEASDFAHTAEVEMIWGNSLIFAGLAGALAYASTPNFNFGAYFLIFGAGFLPGVFLQEASRINVNKAINSYNGIPSRAAWIPEHYFAAPLADGGMAAMSWSF